MKFKTFIKRALKASLPHGFLVIYRCFRYKKNTFHGIVIKTKRENGKRLFVVLKQGIEHPIILRDDMIDIGTFNQMFVSSEYSFHTIKQPNVIVDAGANIGLASIYFANRFPKAKIIAIEPEDNNFKLLETNTKNYPNITRIHAALWGTKGKIDLLDTGLGNNAFMATLPDNHDVVKTPENTLKNIVAAITIDSILEEYGIDKIDILKIDIEGSEKEVFETSDSWINKVDAIIIELHERMKDGCCRAFYNKTNGFEEEWSAGENVYLSRRKCITRA